MDEQRIMNVRLEFFVLLALTAALLLASGAAAQPEVDLSIELVKEPAGFTPPGTAGTLTIIVVNHGPDPAGSIPPDTIGTIIARGAPLPYSLYFGSVVQFFSAGDPDCYFVEAVTEPIPYTYEIEVFYGVFLNELQPGESVECHIRFHVSPYATENLVHNWRVRTPNDIDIDYSNNEVPVVFDLGLAPAIPTLSPVGLTLLVLALFCAFVVVLRRRRGNTANES